MTAVIPPIRTGLFGGAFDPVHKGHLEVVESLIRSRLVGEVWLIPTPVPPHKEEATVSYSHRRKLLELAFHDQIQKETVRICDLEQELPPPNYTLRTVDHLREYHPDHTFFLCVGSDSLATMNRWYRSNELLEKIVPVAAIRPGWSRETISEPVLEKSILVDHKEVEISSTELRKYLGERRAEHLMIPKPVIDYIHRNNLYE